MHIFRCCNDEWRIANSEIQRGTSRRVRRGILLSLFAILNSLFCPRAYASPAPSVRAQEAAHVEIVRRLAPTVTSLFTKDNHAGGGSGVVIDREGYGLSNFHVVAPMLPDRLGDAGLQDGKLRNIEVLGIDPTGDVAMFRFTRRGAYAAVELGDSDSLRVGDACLAMGNPFGLADDYSPTVTLGIISGLHRYQAGTHGALTYSDCIQVDTSINPGNSGGPLFDMNGRLIGINGRVAIEERGRVNVGVGFAITIDQIKRFIPALRAGLAPAHGSAGFTAADHDTAVLVDQVDDGSAAYRAGIRAGDRLLRFAGDDVQSANHFLSILGTFPSGWPIEIVYRRLEKTEKVHLRLDALPLPDLTRGRRDPHAERFDLYAATPMTDRANRDAVRRAFKSYTRALGSDDAIAAVHTIQTRGKRYLAGKPADPPTPLVLTHPRPDELRVHPTDPPDAIEGIVRWALMAEEADKPHQDCKVIGADEVRGRIAVVIENKIGEDFSFKSSFDDEEGRLLAVEFKHTPTGKRVRYEYEDVRRVGLLKLPHKRWTFLDDELFAEDQFDSIQVQEKPQ